MRIPLVTLFTILILVTSCKSTKTLVGKDNVVKERVALKNYRDLQPQFKTINGKIKAVYETEDDNQSLNITYRIEKDKTIWMSAKLMGLLTMAKVKITPDEVQFYEKINKTYFKGDFSLAKKYLGIQVGFEQLQNLLLGINFYKLKTKDLDYLAPNFISITEPDPKLIFTAVIDAKKFQLQQQTLARVDRSLEVSYKQYRFMNGFFYPEDLLILAKENNKTVSIKLNFRSASLNEDLSFPFSIPSNYKPMEL